MEKWEYKAAIVPIYLGTVRDLDQVNALGQVGWEVVCMVGSVVKTGHQEFDKQSVLMKRRID